VGSGKEKIIKKKTKKTDRVKKDGRARNNRLVGGIRSQRNMMTMTNISSLAALGGEMRVLPKWPNDRQ
jgi:hypothetical protein